MPLILPYVCVYIHTTSSNKLAPEKSFKKFTIFPKAAFIKLFHMYILFIYLYCQ